MHFNFTLIVGVAFEVNSTVLANVLVGSGFVVENVILGKIRSLVASSCYTVSVTWQALVSHSISLGDHAPSLRRRK